MGLDMYLYRREKGIEENDEEVGYWRKCNQIHKYFVDNVQEGVDDCGEYLVSKEDLEDLLDRCEKVSTDISLAPDLLPSGGGFFFGSTEYDEHYIDDLESTILIIEPILEDYDPNFEIYYSSSW